MDAEDGIWAIDSREDPTAPILQWQGSELAAALINRGKNRLLLAIPSGQIAEDNLQAHMTDGVAIFGSSMVVTVHMNWMGGVDAPTVMAYVLLVDMGRIRAATYLRVLVAEDAVSFFHDHEHGEAVPEWEELLEKSNAWFQELGGGELVRHGRLCISNGPASTSRG